MKYGESAFVIYYLLTAIIIGAMILTRAGSQREKRIGYAVLILGCGDAFHLVPRVLNYFVQADFSAALGVGKLVTSVTMTIFYVLLYRSGCDYYKVREHKAMDIAVYALALIRIVVCLLPQNGWLQNSSSMRWGILRNIPFVILGILVIILFHRNRRKISQFRNIWLLILLSFAFYVPVAVLAGKIPMLGMLMLPKTVCYLIMIYTFYGFAKDR